MIELGLSSKTGSSPRGIDLVRQLRMTFRPGQIAHGLDKLVEILGKEALLCARPLALLARFTEYRVFEERLGRCLALGQLLRRPPGAPWDGQFGLYGTAAGIELLSRSNLAADFRQEAFDHPTAEQKHWAQTFLALFNFLDVIVRGLSTVEGSKYWEQTRTTLRICSLLRALGDVNSTVLSFSTASKSARAECSSALLGDVSASFSASATSELGTILCSLLASSRSDTNPPTFRFASIALDGPETWGEKTFIWSSVIVAIVRAYSGGILTEVQVAAVCDSPDVSALIDLVESGDHFQDLRCKIYALWALSHLVKDGRPTENAMPGFHNVPGRLLLSDRQAQNLRISIRNACEEALRTDYHLTDLHWPYQILFEGPAPPDQSRPERHRDEYIVVPVLPIVVDLVARFRPLWVLRPAVSRIVLELSEAWSRRDDDSNLELLPLQVGAYNGTVNMLYYEEACRRVSGRLRTRSMSGFVAAVSLQIWDGLKASPQMNLFLAVVFGTLLFLYPVKPWISILVATIFTVPLWWRNFWSFGIGFVLGVLEHLVADALKK